MPIRVGLIGTIGHIRYVLDGIPELDDVELTAAAKGNPEAVS